MTTPHLLRTFVAVLALALSAVAALSTASPAQRSDAMRQEGAGRLVRQRPHRPPLSANCYEEAIDAIPDDLRDYADAEDVITRALQAALRGELAPGGADPTPNDDDPSGNGTRRERLW